MSNEKKSKQKSIRLNQTVIDSVERMAEEQNRTFNNMVETILLNKAREQQFL